MKFEAEISECENYRYSLTREWDKDKGKVLFIMLNPSTACDESNDLTTIRCINYAKRWGYGGITIGNLYPYRAKRPKHLNKWIKEYKYNSKFHKSYNQGRVRTLMASAGLVVCAWGNHQGEPPEWLIDASKELNKPLHHLELCKDGTPKHPLGNLSNDLKPIEYKTSWSRMCGSYILYPNEFTN
jgi:hypothetical protein|tara:strand:+ start:29 stop:580 length:552 start_codon:yes stop_codon:yes gene_type:complete